jgi:DNA ligase-1
MNRSQQTFTDLYLALRDTSRSEEKVALLVEYLQAVSDEEFGWAVHLLQGGSFRGGVKSRELREWAGEVAGVPDWLVEESYSVAGDLAETVSLLVAGIVGEVGAQQNNSLALWIERIHEISLATPDARKILVHALWQTMTQPQILVFTKLLTGGLRIGVAKGLVAKALAQVLGVSHVEVWQRLAGGWRPEELTREALGGSFDPSKSIAPYPFFLAYPLEPDTLAGLPFEEWQCEFKWDGIRAQVVKRAGRVAIWSRGDELVSETFPELCDDAAILPDGVVLDGEIVAWSSNGHPASFSELQGRLNRKKVSAALRKRTPVHFLAYDILEYGGCDIRAQTLRERRGLLSAVYEASLGCVGSFSLPAPLCCSSWEEARIQQQNARARHAEGVMLKRLDSQYGVGRTARGAWWKWKVEPLSIDAVLLYAQKGHGRRADLFTDYTFGVWDGEKLVTFAKAYSGLSDSEITEVDAFIKRNTQERFGPVRTVKPELVFEIAFEAIWPSKRHRAGVAVRFPRIVRWRRDKSAREADTLEVLRSLGKIVF